MSRSSSRGPSLPCTPFCERVRLSQAASTISDTRWAIGAAVLLGDGQATARSAPTGLGDVVARARSGWIPPGTNAGDESLRETSIPGVYAAGDRPPGVEQALPRGRSHSSEQVWPPRR